MLLPLVVIMSSADAANIRFKQSGDWFQTETVEDDTVENDDGLDNGWQAPGVPGVDDVGRANWGGNTITLMGDAPPLLRMQLGVDESGSLQISAGGILTTSEDVVAGTSNNNVGGGEVTGTLEVNDGGVVNVGRILWSARGNTEGIININAGGILNVASHLWLGEIGNSVINISGTLQQNGGILGLGTKDAVNPSGGKATLNINDGGLLALNNISGGGTSIQPDSVLNINGTGQLTLPGDMTGVLTNYVNDGKITGNAGSSILNIDLTTNAGFTTVTAGPIVEPNDAPVLISNFNFSQDTEEISFTWNSLDGEQFLVSYSLDLMDWSGELEERYDSDAGLTTTYSVNRSNLLGADTAGAVYFRVERLAD